LLAAAGIRFTSKKIAFQINEASNERSVRWFYQFSQKKLPKTMVASSELQAVFGCCLLRQLSPLKLLQGGAM